MCITKKSVRESPMPQTLSTMPKARHRPKTVHRPVALPRPAEKKDETPAEKSAVSAELALMETQCSLDNTLVENTQEDSPSMTPSADKRLSKGDEDDKAGTKKRKKSGERTGRKFSKLKIVSSKMGNTNPIRSPNRGKKASKPRLSGPNTDDFSINNEKTEFLENAQLTKLMSHADVKALMGGPLTHGVDADENSCLDTLEEIDSEMENMLFSPLLAGIVLEEEKPFGALPNPHEAAKKGEGSVASAAGD
uniref:Uncharacterized protein n=2 Tax=Caenorhabditis japonica TaxID=281687 RepID=A0A8R1HWK1_CAEJA